MINWIAIFILLIIIIILWNKVTKLAKDVRAYNLDNDEFLKNTFLDQEEVINDLIKRMGRAEYSLNNFWNTLKKLKDRNEKLANKNPQGNNSSGRRPASRQGQ